MKTDHLRHMGIGVVEFSQIVPHSILIILGHRLIPLNDGLHNSGEPGKRVCPLTFAALHQMIELLDFRQTIKHIGSELCPKIIDIVDIG